MPVRIGNIGIAGNHTVVADKDFMGRADSHSRANQTIVADSYTSLALLFRPDGQPDIFIGRCHHIDIIAQFNWSTKDFHMPGAHKRETLSEVFKLRAQEVIDIKFLEFQVSFFKIVWTMVSSQ